VHKFSSLTYPRSYYNLHADDCRNRWCVVDVVAAVSLLNKWTHLADCALCSHSNAIIKPTPSYDSAVMTDACVCIARTPTYSEYNLLAGLRPSLKDKK